MARPCVIDQHGCIEQGSAAATPSSGPSLEVVLSHCREDSTSMLRDVQGALLRSVPNIWLALHVFEKCNGNGAPKMWPTDGWARERQSFLVNKGEECYAYLTYITTWWDSLPSHLVFLQGDGVWGLSGHWLRKFAHFGAVVVAPMRTDVYCSVNDHQYLAVGLSHATCARSGVAAGHCRQDPKMHACMTSLRRRRDPHNASAAAESEVVWSMYTNAQFGVSVDRIRSRTRSFWQGLRSEFDVAETKVCFPSRGLRGGARMGRGTCSLFEFMWPSLMGESTILSPHATMSGRGVNPWRGRRGRQQTHPRDRDLRPAPPTADGNVCTWRNGCCRRHRHHAACRTTTNGTAIEETPGALVQPSAVTTIGNQPALGVLLRGEAFRTGHWSSLSHSHAKSGAPQASALVSHVEHLLSPARQKGWACVWMVDVVLPQLYQLLFTNLTKPLHALAERITHRRRALTQVASWASSLRWALPLLRLHVPQYRALLVMRVDVHLKLDFPLPPPGSVMASSDQPLLTPFLHPKELEVPEMCDVILFVPRGRDALLLATLERHRGGGGASLHHLPKLMRVAPILQQRYDSAPDLMWNPLYKLADRRERSQHAPLHSKVLTSPDTVSFYKGARNRRRMAPAPLARR